jgi:hypothetical protein
MLYSSATCRGYQFQFNPLIYFESEKFMDAVESFEVDSSISKKRRRRYNVGAANEVRLQRS